MNTPRNCSYNDMASLVASIMTTAKVNRFYEDISLYVAVLYKAKTENTQDRLSIENSLNDSYDFVIKKLSNGKNDEEIISSLNELVSFVRDLPVVTLTLAVNPPAKFIKELYVKLTSLVNKLFILDLRIDGSILGGARYDLFGNYTDMSLVTRLNNYFTQNKNAILSELQK